MDYFGRLHPNSLIYKAVTANPLGLPSTGDARVQESTMFVRQVWDYARWSAGPPLEAIICGMFGLSPNAFEDSVIFTPQIPDDWSNCSLENAKIGDHIVHFEYDKPNWTVIHVRGTDALTVTYRTPLLSDLLATSQRFGETGQDVQSIAPGSSHIFRPLKKSIEEPTDAA